MANTRRTRDQWQALVDEHKDSDLTVKAFCQKNEINYASFSAWKQRLSPRTKAPESSSLIKVHCPQKPIARPTHPILTYTSVSGSTLSWSTEVDPSYISSILRGFT